MKIDEITGLVVQSCIKIHKRVGPACLEHVYEELLYYELCLLGLDVLRQRTFPIRYDDLLIPGSFRLDLFVALCLPVEIKSIHPLAPVHFDQVRSQIALLNLRNGMLINFKVSRMVDGIHRVFNNRGSDALDINLFPIK